MILCLLYIKHIHLYESTYVYVQKCRDIEIPNEMNNIGKHPIIIVIMSLGSINFFEFCITMQFYARFSCCDLCIFVIFIFTTILSSIVALFFFFFLWYPSEQLFEYVVLVYMYTLYTYIVRNSLLFIVKFAP